MENFFGTVYQAILRLIPFQTLKAVVLASPGFVKDSVGQAYPAKANETQLYDYIFQQAMLTTNKPLLNCRSKFIKVHSNTSHVHSLVEAMRAPEVAKMLQGAKFAREGIGLDKWVKTDRLCLSLLTLRCQVPQDVGVRRAARVVWTGTRRAGGRPRSRRHPSYI